MSAPKVEDSIATRETAHDMASPQGAAHALENFTGHSQDRGSQGVNTVEKATGYSQDDDLPGNTSTADAHIHSSFPGWKVCDNSAGWWHEWDLEAADVEERFSDKSVRRAFVRKVYAILLVHLLYTLGIMAIFIWVAPVNVFAHNNVWLMCVALGLTFALIIPLICTVTMTATCNYLALVAFTISAGCLLGSFSALYQVLEVVVAVAALAIIMLCLTIFALQSTIDLTLKNGFRYVFTLVLIVFITKGCLWPDSVYWLIITGAFVLGVSFYLVFESLFLMERTHTLQVNPEEYVFAAVWLFFVIVLAFMNLLLVLFLFADH